MKATVTHALAAIGYIAENYQDGSVISARISKEYSISMKYLLRMLEPLVKAHILKSKGGSRGGFSLTRDPKEISMLQIIEAVDGPLMEALPTEGLKNRTAFIINIESICKKATEKEMELYDKAKLSDMLK